MRVSKAGTFYAEYREDRILARLLPDAAGTCLEVGAYDGVDRSNTYLFERHGWRCILVEPNSELCERIRASRTAVVFECAASEKCGEAVLYLGAGINDLCSSLEAQPAGNDAPRKAVLVPTRTIDSMLDEAGVNLLAFATIDVEGHEIQVLRGFALDRWKPGLLVVEDNSNSADSEVEEYLCRAEYFRFWRTGPNDWYAPAGTGRVRLLAQILFSGCFSWIGFLKGTLPKPWLRKLIPSKRAIAGRIRNWLHRQP